MHELTGRLSGVTFSYETGKPLITFEMNEKRSALDMVDTLREYANAYCWTLIGKIAEKTNASTSEIYRAAIKEIGGNYDIVCVQDEAVESLCQGWQRNGIGWQTDTIPSKIDGCTNVILYYGSSTYDTSQMSRLINIIVQDCEALNIETRSEEELESLLNSWGR